MELQCLIEGDASTEEADEFFGEYPIFGGGGTSEPRGLVDIIIPEAGPAPITCLRREWGGRG